MAKHMVGQVRFQVPGGQATPAPPVGTSLGRFGINLGQFVQQFNERTKEHQGLRVPVIVKVYNDRSFELTTKGPVVADLLKQAAGIAKGSGTTPKEKVGKVTRDAGRGDRQEEDGRPERQRRGSCPADGRRNGPEHGVGRGRIRADSGRACPAFHCGRGPR